MSLGLGGKGKSRGATRRVSKAEPVKTPRAQARPRNTEVKRQSVSKQKTSSSGLTASFDSLWASHKAVAIESVQRLISQFWSSMMTWAVIGIALALPLALHLLVSNISVASQGWDGAPRLSLFLHENVSDQQAQKLTTTLRQRSDINSVEYISRQQALDEFKLASGFDAAIESLDENPLPAVITLQPKADDVVAIDNLKIEIEKLPSVAAAQLDMEWVQRLYSMMSLLERVVMALALLLSAAVILVIGNTIRLAIEGRRDEILVIKLVGGSDSFVRRPFLYTGLWYGLGGALIAWLVIQISLLWLGGPVERLANLYHEQYQLQGLGFGLSLSLFLGAALLGWLGARLSLGRHLRAIEP